MAQFVEFVGNNWMLVSLWVALVVALILHRSKTTASAVGMQQAVFLINRKDAVVLDVRAKNEFDAGHIVDAINIPMINLAGRVKELEKYKSRPIVVACKMGQHSGEACKILANAGFEDVVRISGGVAAWRADQLPLVSSTAPKAVARDAKKDGGRKKQKKGKPGKQGEQNSQADQPEASRAPDDTGVTDQK
jgi:rhodanese-related sulfurtransferase